tara:strand:+ start:523 stop:687 length:165 start_codon:yes stop_codon:yes gene_type:complete
VVLKKIKWKPSDWFKKMAKNLCLKKKAAQKRIEKNKKNSSVKSSQNFFSKSRSL